MKAVLDACVLYPTVMREMLLGAARACFFEPFWSARILKEWELAAARDGQQVQASARVDIALLADHFKDALVQADEAAVLHPLPDPDDEHVLAAAIAAGADVLVTKNYKDFPSGVLAQYGVARSDPDLLLLSFWEEDTRRMERVVEEVVAKTAAVSGEAQVARKLIKRAGLPRLAKRLG